MVQHFFELRLQDCVQNEDELGWSCRCLPVPDTGW